ncbi:NUDIX hydrolase [Streptosporangium canum]|uniref:NUDIX hydrolase n=1 Tax=Streptosporangium canum TaxID=324952 RepID=UPI00378E924C
MHESRPQYAYEQISHPGGESELRIHLSAKETAALGADALSFVRDLDPVLRALAEIRAGDWDQVSPSPYDEGRPGARQRRRMEDAIYAVEQYVLPRLSAIRTVALRSFRAQGASYADLAAAMGISRSTAQSRWRVLEATAPDKHERWVRDVAATETGPEVCDHASVGVLITDEHGRHLMFDRAKPPAGCAPVAGHVDTHGDPERAARAEVAEEVGLTVTDLTQVTGGWRPNRCRRPVAASRQIGHHWTIYRATVAGDLAPSADETRNARWLDTVQLQQLTDRTAAYARSELADAEFAQAPGIEPVWVWWLHVLGIVNVAETDLSRIEDLATLPAAGKS